MATARHPLPATAATRSMRPRGATTTRTMPLHPKAVQTPPAARHYEYVAFVLNPDLLGEYWSAYAAAYDEMSTVPNPEDLRTKTIFFGGATYTCAVINKKVADGFFQLQQERGWYFRIFRSLDCLAWFEYKGPKIRSATAAPNHKAKADLALLLATGKVRKAG